MEEAIAKDNSADDLYYRLNVFAIFMPPLLSANQWLCSPTFFWKSTLASTAKASSVFSTRLYRHLASYHWPGNVRELENIIERAVLVCETNVIHGHHLPPTLQTAEGSGTVTRLSLESSVEAFERDIIMDALKTTRGNRKRAAKLLDTTERVIGYKVRKYAIDCDRFDSKQACRRKYPYTIFVFVRVVS